MFNFFKKKTEVQKLEKKYKDLMEEAFKLSTSNRAKSDAKQAEAEEVIRQLESIRKK